MHYLSHWFQFLKCHSYSTAMHWNGITRIMDNIRTVFSLKRKQGCENTVPTELFLIPDDGYIRQQGKYLTAHQHLGNRYLVYTYLPWLSHHYLTKCSSLKPSVSLAINQGLIHRSLQLLRSALPHNYAGFQIHMRAFIIHGTPGFSGFSISLIIP